MKTEFVDVNETRKNVRVEIPTDVVNAEIDRIARDYSRKARIPGFRPGKAPTRVIKQRYKDQILHDVVHDLIPRAVDEAVAVALERLRDRAARYEPVEGRGVNAGDTVVLDLERKDAKGEIDK